MSEESNPTIGFVCVFSDPKWPDFHSIEWTSGHPGDLARQRASAMGCEVVTIDYFVLCLFPAQICADLRRHLRYYGVDFSENQCGGSIMYGVDLCDVVSITQQISETLPSEFRGTAARSIAFEDSLKRLRGEGSVLSRQSRLDVLISKIQPIAKKKERRIELQDRLWLRTANDWLRSLETELQTQTAPTFVDRLDFKWDAENNQFLADRMYSEMNGSGISLNEEVKFEEVAKRLYKELKSWVGSDHTAQELLDDKDEPDLENVVQFGSQNAS